MFYNNVTYYYIRVLATYINFIAMGRLRYTKAHLEELVFTQLENLNAIHDLLRIIKTQNELLQKTNDKLSKQLTDHKNTIYPKPSRRRKRDAPGC